VDAFEVCEFVGSVSVAVVVEVEGEQVVAVGLWAEGDPYAAFGVEPGVPVVDFVGVVGGGFLPSFEWWDFAAWPDGEDS